MILVIILQYYTIAYKSISQDSNGAEARGGKENEDRGNSKTEGTDLRAHT